MEENGQLYKPAALPPGKKLPVTIGWEAGWAQRRSECGDEEKVPTLAGNGNPILQTVV